MKKISSLIDLKATRLYLARIGAEPRSLRTAVIKEEFGRYWKDISVIKFSKEGDVQSDARFAPTESEAVAIKDEFKTVKFPELKPLHKIVSPPEMIAKAKPSDIYEFRNTAGLITMVQVRIERKGEKSYVPWTYWDDDTWRNCEPDGPLPLYNVHLIKDATTVFIHEGAKAARICQEMIEAATPAAKERLAAHPWGVELGGAVHLGWIGGALSPYRTDWGALSRLGVKRAYIVADNDAPGKAAVPAIAYHLHFPVFTIQFTDEFPVSFDLGDDFPSSLYGETDGIRHYIGPAFRECLHPATWATDLLPNPKGKPSAVLRDSFKAMWAYVEEADMYVCTEMPEIIRPETILNKMLAPFSHVSETARLIVRAYRGRSVRIAYRPDVRGLQVTSRGSSAINLHIPSTIKPAEGNPKPWTDFLDYLFPDPTEKQHMARWCATLIARPDIRMGYGILLVTEHQGIGKTTLAEQVLAPLVGFQNVSYPRESDIVESAFNEWQANKRLIIMGEIYSGANWKAYHKLKGVITDRDISVNQKFQRPYLIDNWCHVFATSNSMRALKMENDDRRWFYPEVTETPWSGERFTELRKWFRNGGLGIIKKWAQAFRPYVSPSDRAPMTERKKDLIEGSRSEAQREAASLAESLATLYRPAALAMKEIVIWLRQQVQGKVFDSDYEVRRAMLETGLEVYPKRIKVHGMLQYILMNEKLSRVLKAKEEEEHAAILRDSVIKPGQLIETDM